MMIAAKGEMQWGDIATWVGGVATAFAFFATVIVLLLQRSELRIAREERSQQAQDRQRDQARLVSFWLADRENVSNRIYRLKLHARNGSTEPIYNWRMWLRAVGEAEHISETFHYALGPGEDHVSPVEIPFDVGRSDRLWVQAEFTDSAGSRWARRLDGALVLVDEGLPPDSGDPATGPRRR
jgi:hypothetical protein